MFTGIIEEVGTIKRVGSGWLVIGAEKVLEDTKPGDSIAVNGACLTVTSIDNDGFSGDVMPETVRHTNLGRLHHGDFVNLERAMLATSRFGGNIVQGHVDGTGEVISIIPQESAMIVRIALPVNLMSYIVVKGFITVDGASLTITDYDEISFSVSLVGYTRQQTTLGRKKPGDTVNLEADIIAKYVERLRKGDSKALTLDILEENGFLKTR